MDMYTLDTAMIRLKEISEALESGEYYREYRFAVNIPANLIDESIPLELSDESVVLQGSVDLAIMQEDGIIIVDYKTDRVKNLDALVQLYSKQLALYRLALEQTTGKKVKKCLIYSIHLSDSKEVL